MKYFKPDAEFAHFSEITAEFLENNNIKTIFSDLDSTLAIHDRPADDDGLRKWISMLHDHGVTLVVASNNTQGRVDRFCEPYGIIGIGNCMKPSPMRIQRRMPSIGATTETSLFLGDQLLTDVWCGKRLGMKTVLVHPIGKEHEPLQIVLKRKIEKWIKQRW